MKKYNWIFWIPIIGEFYLLLAWAMGEEYPLKVSSFFSGVYQGFWASLLILYIYISYLHIYIS